MAVSVNPLMRNMMKLQSTGGSRCLVVRGQPHLLVAKARGLGKLRQVNTRAAVADVQSVPTTVIEKAQEFPLVCPICLTTDFKTSTASPMSSKCRCDRCQRDFSVSKTFMDLTLTSGIESKVFQQKGWFAQELFRNPAISFVYERGWRQGFAWAGFPGADKEYDMAMDYLKPAYGGLLVDMSCGSGLFTRRFAKSGKFSGVIAADFSESMLQQTRLYLEEDKSLLGSTPIALVRADVGRMPFATGSIDALHAGAALHCWPNAQAAIAEISRVLKPGGTFVASTFLTATAPLGQMFGDDVVRPLNALNQPTRNTVKLWEEAELRELAAMAGLQNFTCYRVNRFIMLAATKPGASRP